VAATTSAPNGATAFVPPNGPAPLLYVTLAFSGATTFSSLPTFTFKTSPLIDPSSGTFYLAELIDGVWQPAIEGPAVASNGQLVFSGPKSTIDYPAGVPVAYALYFATANAPTLSATMLNINGVGAANAASLTASESQYTGTLTESDTCSQIAAVTPHSELGPSLGMTVTGVSAGTCTATVSDANGHSASATVVVTTTSLGVGISHNKHSLPGPSVQL
jgi:hypothetical protein